jgi:DNA repair exonuclease SbcCD ATPase subunit
MRKTLYTIIASALLLGGAACKKDNSDTTDKSAMEVRKAEEKVADQKEDVRDEVKDVKQEVEDVQEENKELAAETKDVAVAKGDLAQAKATYATALNQRLAKLEARGTAEAKRAAADYRTRRDAIGAKLNQIKTQAQAGWSDFTKSIDDDFDKLEHDVFDALD